MADDVTALLRLISGKSSVRVDLGFFRGFDGARATIDAGGGRIPAEMATDFEPEVNEQVQILWVDGKPFVLGAARPKPATGVVFTSPAGGMVVVDTDAGQITAPYNNDIALSSGMQVRIHWGGGPYVMSVMSTQPVAPVDPGAGGSGGGTKVEAFGAIQSGSWQLNGSKWSTTEPRASNGYLGAWHYGSKIRDTIPASAELVSLEVFVAYASKFGNPPNFALHDQGSQAGAPNLTSSFPWAVTDGWNSMPPAQAAVFFAALKAGGGSVGIGLDHGGQNRFKSIGEEPQSGKIRITYRL